MLEVGFTVGDEGGGAGVVQALRGGEGDLLGLAEALSGGDDLAHRLLLGRVEVEPAHAFSQRDAGAPRRQQVGAPAGDHVLPVRAGVFCLGRRLGALADRKDVVVVEQVTRWPW